MNASQLTTIILILFTLNACQKNPEIEVDIEDSTIANSIEYSEVDQRLWVYFQRFEEEAQKRGETIDLNALALTGAVDEIEQEHVAGQCTHSSHHPNHVLIDQTFFEESSDLIVEFIIFHELGHCVLDRDHREDSDTNGFCRSIMRSGLGDCRDHYSLNTRENYIDELFDPSGN